MLPVIQLGPLAVPASGLIILAGLWLGLTLAERNAQRCGITPAQLSNLAFAALIGGLLGARLSYVLRYPDIFLSDPLSMISPNPGLLDPSGGLAGALIAGLVYGQRKGLQFWPALDAFTPLLAVASLAVGMAHLASGAAFGSVTSLPWGIELWGAQRHPSQVYEIIAAGLILALVWPGRGPVRPGLPGVYFLSFLALSAGAALLLAGFRGDSRLIFGGIRLEQLTAWLALAASLSGLTYIKFRRPVD